MGNLAEREKRPQVVCEWQGGGSGDQITLHIDLRHSAINQADNSAGIVQRLRNVFERSCLDLSIKIIPNNDALDRVFCSHTSPSSVTQLILRNKKHITSVPVSLGYFYNLTVIDLSRNNLSSLPWSLVCLKNVSRFDVSHNALRAVPRTICYMEALTHVNFSHNPIATLPTELLLLTQLIHLNLDGCENLESPQKSNCSDLESVRGALRKRQGRRNAWESNQHRRYDDNIDRVSTLLDLCIETVVNCGIDFLSCDRVPTLVKNHLEREVQSQRARVQPCKCTGCASHFSSREKFDTHTCRGRNKTTQTTANDCSRAEECQDSDDATAAMTDGDDLYLCAGLEKQTQTDPAIFDHILSVESKLLEAYYERSKLDFKKILIRRHEMLEKMLSQHPLPQGVTQLIITGKELPSVPACINLFPNLTALNLANNHLVRLPDTISSLHGLLFLDLSCNKLAEIPLVIAHLSNLNCLNVANNRIVTLPTEILSLPKLEKLDISGMQCFGKAVLNQSKLSRMLMDRFERTDVFQEWASSKDDVISLYVLSFRTVISNRVDFSSCARLPPDTRNCLEKASKTQTGLLKICKCSFCLGIFSSRDAFCDHVCVPFGRGGKKRTLLGMKINPEFHDIVTQRLSRFLTTSYDTKTLKQAFTSKTKTVDLSRTGINSNHELGCVLRNLDPNAGCATTFVLRNLKSINQLPLCIGTLVNVTCMDVSNNDLSDLPWSIVYMDQLRELNISHNTFIRLPSCVGELKNLRLLKASYNPLIVLPISLVQLHNLEKLELKGCRSLTSPNQDVYSKGLDAIKEFLEDRKCRNNVWASHKPWYEENTGDSTQKDGEYVRDSCENPPTGLKNLVKTKQAPRRHVDLFKCAHCHKVFSNRTIFDDHACLQ